jgi:YesN/AraC family two-component response regulator
MPENSDASSATTDMGAILLIDDDDLVLQSLSLTLDDSGYTVTTANSGQKAVAICRTESFEVVICDIRMPGMNGIDTLRAIKEIQPDVRTVVITG